MNNEVEDYDDEVPALTPAEVEANTRKFRAYVAANRARKDCRHTHGCVLDVVKDFTGQPRACARCVRCQEPMSAVREHPVWGTVYAFKCAE